MLFITLTTMGSYMEPDNVTCNMCTWAVHSPWHYMWQLNGSRPSTGMPKEVFSIAARAPPTCNTSEVHNETDYRGNDLQVEQTATLEACQALCCTTLRCSAYTFEPQTDVIIGTCVRGKPCCFLKSSIDPTPKTIPGGVFSGSVSKPTQAVHAPPNGNYICGSVSLTAVEA